MTVVEVDAVSSTADARALVAAYWTPRRVVWGLVVLGVTLRAWVVASGWFYWDDYIFQGRAWRLPLDATYLLHGHDGHFMPGAFLLQWPITRLWPMNYVPLLILLVLGQAAVGVSFARLALRWFGSRWLVVVPVTMVVVSPSMLPTDTWWAAALNGIPMQLALIAMLSAVRTWHRSGRRWGLRWGLLAWLVLLPFSEKVVVVPWAALLLVPALSGGRPVLRSLVDAVRRAWLEWAAAAVVSAAYLLVYSAEVGKQPNADALPSQVSDLVGRGLAASLVPAVAGGPLRWEPVGFGSAIGHPPAWLVIVSCEALAVLVVWSSTVSRAARRTWVWAGGYVLGALLLVATGRINAFVDPVIVQGLRYTADATIPLAVAVGAALVAVAASARRVLGGARGDRRGVVVGRGVLATGTAAVVLLSVVSISSYRDLWRDNPSRTYVANAEVALAAAADGPRIIDQPAPVSVLYGLAYPYNQVAWLLSPVSPRPEFGDPTTKLRIIDDVGNLRPAVVEGPSAAPGPEPGCGWRVEGARTTVRLANAIIPFSHTVRIGYISTGKGTVGVRLGDGPARQFDVSRGLSEVVITLDGGGTTMTFEDLTPGVAFCTDEVHIGVPVAVAP
jgi:hypothetical protein